jgi:hypothetical protein
MKGYWNNLRPFEKRVVVGVAAMVFVVFNVWFVLPHFSDWGRVNIRIAAARAKLKNYQSEVGQIHTISNQVWVLEREGLSVPPEEQSVQFVRMIQTQAAQSQVNILSSGRITERTNAFFLELSQTLNLQSGEGPLVEFLVSLGSGNSLLRVRDLTLRPDAPHQLLSTGVKLVASFQKKAPARRPAAPAAGPPQKGPAQVLPPHATNAPGKAPVSGPKSNAIRSTAQTNKAASSPVKPGPVVPPNKRP